VDQARLATRFQLFAQVAHVDLDHLRLADELVPPPPLEYRSAVQHLIGMLQEEPQQLVLGRGEGDRAAAAPRLARRGVQPEIGEPELALIGRGAAQPDADPRQQLFEGKRLDEVVVRSLL
jgi:hypothetical protein